MKYLFATLLMTATAQLVHSQAVPPRLSIPGAVPVAGYRPQFRNEKVVRVRRPTALRATNALIPQVPPRILEEDKPVTESAEDNHPDIYLPQLLREQQLAQTQQSQFQQQAASFISGEPNSVQDVFSQGNTHLLSEEFVGQTPTPQILPISQPSRAPQRPSFNDYGIGRFGNDRPQALPAAAPSQQPAPLPARNNVIRSRPQLRAQYDAPSIPAPTPRLRPKPIQSRPAIDQNQLQDEREENYNRRQQPVAQTIRKWREENEDGSITWGYENDDGSFKEELIGMDCVTKGTYGYIDPDGNKREYHYETGIKCDPNTRETEEESRDNGYINYEDQKAVFPNGVEIDMSQLGRKKSKRPGANFRE